MPHLDLDDQRLEYRWIGQDDGRPVLVFLHEGLGCIGLWRDIPQRIAAAAGLPAFLYTRRGYGGSDPVEVPRPIDYLHREANEVLPAVLRAVGIERFILIGHSDGATIALLYAAGAPAPGLLGIVLEAPHVFVEDETIAGIRVAEAAFRSGDLRTALARHHGANVDCAFWGWCETWLSPQFRDWNIESCLPHVRVPVQIIQGIDDEYATERQVRAIAEGVAGPAEPILLESCGHTPHRDRPDAVLDAVIGFASRVCARGTA